jgi:predicted Zn-dependent protease
MISAQNLIERITSAATCDDCIVILTETSQANLRWANSTLTTNGVILQRSITVIAFVAVDGGMSAGAVTRTDISADQIDAVLKEAIASARSAGAADDAAEIAKNVSFGNWSDAHNATGPDVFSKVAPDLGDMFKRSVSDGIELFGYAEHTHKTTWVGSKGGIRARYDQPAGRVEMTAKSHNRSRSTFEGVATRDFSNVSIASVDAKIRERLQWQANKIDIPAGKYDTVLPANAVGDLVLYMLWSAGARDAFEGRSAFSKKGGGTRIGEKLSSLPLNIYSDSAYKGLESIPFVASAASSALSSVFDNGQSLKRNDFIKGGVLSSLAQTQSSAKITSLAYTPVGDNLVVSVDGASGSMEDLVKKVDDGLLLTTMWYIREVDPSSLLLTGLTRDGVYRVKDGEVIGAVNNFRWNESPIAILSRISHVASTEITQLREWADYFDRCAAPAMVIKDFNMSTVSPAN